MATSDKYRDILLLAKETGGGLTSEQVLARGLPWDAVGEVYLTQAEIALVKKYDKKHADKALLIECVRSR